MENASKALIMAAEILLGIMLISIAIYLFNMFANYSKSTNDQIESAQLAQFNDQFLKYEGKRTNKDGKLETIKCTMHNITSLVNLAKKNNEEYELLEEDGKKDGTFYIQIDINSNSVVYPAGVNNGKNLEKLAEDKLADLMKENSLDISYDEEYRDTIANTKYFKCKCYISTVTSRVNYIVFEDYE